MSIMRSGPGLRLGQRRDDAADGASTLLPLSEVFGPTIQGEGPFAGRPCAFVRLGLCNLACEWCDTPFTWDTTRYDVAAECPDTAIGTIHRRLREHAPNGSLVVLSGGEPLMHYQRLRPLLTQDWLWHVETNGTIAPPAWWLNHVTHTVISPKIATADPERKRIKVNALSEWANHARSGRASFKFVVRGTHEHATGDIRAVDTLVANFRLDPREVWVMAEGVTAHDIIVGQRVLAPLALERRYNLTTRLHTLLWDDERGH